ncbi:MAG: RHS repeat-associated core domain-containing protein [Limisphaerales bacterium]
MTALLTTTDKTNAPVRSYTWGLDASGSMQGAGGVGGLLMVNAGTNAVHFPAYDLNGNVMGLVNATNGIISAKYEYGPFGEVFCSVGDMAKVNPFGFSTKYTDNETDLVYYGYRYYSPALGRWLSRDPIEEKGGLNLYGFVNNDPVNKWDKLGLQGNDKGPFRVGWEWFSGSGPQTNFFENGDDFTELLKKHIFIENIRKKISDSLETRCLDCNENNPDFKPVRYSLAGIPGFFKYAKDYSTILTVGTTGNIAVTYLGSYVLNYHTERIVCKLGIAKIHFNVTNSSTLASATRPPILGYYEWWNNYPGNWINKGIERITVGPLSAKYQIFNWDEFIQFNKNPCCK